MKKLIALTASVLLSLSALARDQIVIASSGGEMSQIAQTILQHAYGKIDIDISIQMFPAARSIVTVNEGMADAEVMRIKGADANFPNLVMVPEHIVSIEWVAVVSKNSDIKLDSWKSLKDYSLAFRRGIRKIENSTKGIEATYVTDYSNALKLVNSGRVDVTVLPKISALKEIKENNLNNVKILEPEIDTTLLFHYLNVQHKGLVPKLSQAIAEMKKTGEFQSLTDQKVKELTQ